MTDLQTNLSSDELLSALVDGDPGARIAISDLDNRMRAQWNAYQAIGNVLRAPPPADSRAIYVADPVFVQRLMQRLANEKVAKADPAVTPGAVAQPHVLAANDTTFRWKLVAGFASFAAMTALTWTLVGAPGSAPEQLAKGTTPGQLATDPVGTERVVASAQGPMVRDARLEELLSAHKQLGGTSLQVPSGFLRNASFESTNNGLR